MVTKGFLDDPIKTKKKKEKEGPRKVRDQALVECTTAEADNLSSPLDFKGAKPQ